MPAPKRVPVEVIEKARAAAALTKQYKLATPPKPAAPAAAAPAPTKKTKLVAALKRLHPMD